MLIVDRTDAKRIVVDYLGESLQSYADKMPILDINETGVRGRNFLGGFAFEECWVAYMTDSRTRFRLAPSRIICILKKTGEIIYDGSEGGGDCDKA